MGCLKTGALYQPHTGLANTSARLARPNCSQAITATRVPEPKR